MNRDGDDAWDPYLDDSFHHVNREDWDESDWEAFLNRQDVLAAKYQELFDTRMKSGQVGDDGYNPSADEDDDSYEYDHECPLMVTMDPM